jgi:hypothetical protein
LWWWVRRFNTSWTRVSYEFHQCVRCSAKAGQGSAGLLGVPEVSIFLSAAGAISSSLSLPENEGSEGRYLNRYAVRLGGKRSTRISYRC